MEDAASVVCAVSAMAEFDTFAAVAMSAAYVVSALEVVTGPGGVFAIAVVSAAVSSVFAVGAVLEL